MKKTVKFILARLREPSTWAGIAAAATAFHANPEHTSAVVTLGPVLAGLAACFLPEGKPEPQDAAQ